MSAMQASLWTGISPSSRSSSRRMELHPAERRCYMSILPDPATTGRGDMLRMSSDHAHRLVNVILLLPAYACTKTQLVRLFELCNQSALQDVRICSVVYVQTGIVM